jgi:hypothetical protein
LSACAHDRVDGPEQRRTEQQPGPASDQDALGIEEIDEVRRGRTEVGRRSVEDASRGLARRRGTKQAGDAVLFRVRIPSCPALRIGFLPLAQERLGPV